MAIKRDSSQKGNSGTALTTLSWSHFVNGDITNSILIVVSGCASASNFNVSTVVWDDGGANTALTRLGRVNDSLTQAWAEIWYLIAPAAGFKTIKVTYSGAVAAATGSSSWSGVHQTTPWNASSPQNATGTEPTQPSVAITSAVGEWVIDSIIDNEAGTDTLAAGSGQTLIHSTTVGANIAAGGSDEAGASSVTMNWTGVSAGATWAIIGASLVPAVLQTSNVIRHPIY